MRNSTGGSGDTQGQVIIATALDSDDGESIGALFRDPPASVSLMLRRHSDA